MTEQYKYTSNINQIPIVIFIIIHVHVFPFQFNNELKEFYIDIKKLSVNILLSLVNS